MKELNILQMEEIEGGGSWHTFCVVGWMVLGGMFGGVGGALIGGMLGDTLLCP